MISKPLEYRVLAVQPSNHEVAPNEARYDFADYDLCIPPFFVTTALFIGLPSSVDKHEIVTALGGGLARTLEQIPIFAGKLQYDSLSKRPFSFLSKDSTVSLGVRHIDEDSSSFPSLREWERSGYSNSELVRHAENLFPPGIAPSDLPLGVRHEPGCAMSAFQVNFIAGGMILISAFHHWQGDAASCNMFCKAWSENTKAIYSNDSEFSLFKASFDRTYCTKPFDMIDEERGQLLLDKSIAMRRVDTGSSQGAENGTGTAPSTTSSPPKIRYQTVHISQDDIARLKEICTPEDSNKYVSTWDCLASLVWRAVVRARQPMHPEWNTTTKCTRLTSAVNIRDRFDVIPKQYIGNCWTRACTDSISINNLLAQPMNVSASMSRKSILEISPVAIPEALELAKYAEGKPQIQPDPSFHLGPDLLATSWAQMKVYDYDFGFGSVRSLRGVAGMTEGMLLYPYSKGTGGEEGYDFGVQLEEGCLARLSHDAELLSFCELRSK